MHERVSLLWEMDEVLIMHKGFKWYIFQLLGMFLSGDIYLSLFHANRVSRHHDKFCKKRGGKLS